KCGGSQIQHKSSEMQLEMKQNNEKKLERKIAHKDDVTVNNPLDMEDSWRYRKNVSIQVAALMVERITGFDRVEPNDNAIKKDTMIVIITRTAKLPHQDELVKELTETYPHIKSIMHNINNRRTNVILGKETKLLYGEKYIYDTIGDIRFAISAKSFYQVNPPQ